MRERTQIILKLLSTHIILLPILIVISIFVTRDSFILLTINQSLLITLFLAGYWEFFGSRIKNFYLILNEVLILIVFIIRLQSASYREPDWYLIITLSVIQTYILFELAKIFIVISKVDKISIEIEFPFRNGNYLITDGGNSKISRFMNYHFYSPMHIKNRTNNSMKFATDIVKIDHSITKFLPFNNEDYLIFGEKVFCPIDGTVIKVVNDIDDNIPYSGNYPYSTGNTIVIKKGIYYLLLGHLKKNSIKVKEGDLVQSNDLLGLAGNSGWTERPHLHMQLIESDSDNYWFGKGICIRYANKNLFKNRLIRI
jgi:hypothetical protein